MVFHGHMTADPAPATSTDRRHPPAPDAAPTTSTEPRPPATASHDSEPSAALVEFMRQGWAPRTGDAGPVAAVARYAARRRRALQHAMPGRTLVVPAGAPKTRNNDVAYPFRASSDFWWLVGANLPDAVLVLDDTDAVLYARAPKSRHDSDEFFRDRQYGELWTGPQPSLRDLERQLDIATAPLEECIERLQRSEESRTVVLRGHDPRVDAVVPPHPDDRSLATLLAELRLLKDDWEIAELTAAADATIRGFADVAREIRAAAERDVDISERWVDGTFWRRARAEGNDVGYPTIAAAGPHACVLHWTRNDGLLHKGQLLLLDAGVETRHGYTADVTRTMPISGAFTEAQRQVYQLVLAAQEAAFAALKPGAAFRDYYRAAAAVLAQGLADWGLLPASAADIDGPHGDLHRRYTLHNPGHMLGLDVHDCAAARRNRYHDGFLEPGHVLTVEPGLYFQPDDLTVPPELRGIGVRIEDDVVITPGGYRNLTAALPRHPDELVRWLAQPTP
ncbi:MAG: aminopeptidase P N-terminal domain-containing protein [Acidothermus cellulolyticus]|nr:aminopeptidase P N-terminal domain-containing protein [Acidothermus cellulolyticus]